MKYLLSLFCLLMVSCQSVPDDQFTYEVINDQRHFEITPTNLITFFELSASEQKALMRSLDYEKDEGIWDYIMKTDTVASDWQTVATKAINPDQISMTWVSVKGNDHFTNFYKLLNKEGHGSLKPEEGIYLLHKNKKSYIAKVTDLIVGTEVTVRALKR